MIFVDTNALVSLLIPTDEFHSQAKEWWDKNSNKVSLLTTNLILIETLGWTRYKKGKIIAVEAGKNFYLGADLRIERVTISDEKKAWKLFQELDGRGISMVDCTSFVAMKRLKIKEAFTFDEDFKKLGFTIYP